MRQGLLYLIFLVASLLAGISSAATEATRELDLERAWGRMLHSQAQPQPGTTVREKKSPIQRVVHLLTEMKTELEKEAANDEEIYDKMVCWCETSEKEKK